jgi:hypothetical protein
MTRIDTTPADLLGMREMLERLLAPSGYSVADIGENDSPSGQYAAFKIIGPTAQYWVSLRRLPVAHAQPNEE